MTSKVQAGTDLPLEGVIIIHRKVRLGRLPFRYSWLAISKCCMVKYSDRSD